MKYYKISALKNLEQIGKYPQIEDVKCDCDPIEDPHFIDNVGYKKINFIPKTPIGILNNGANLTDFIISPSIGYTNKLIISNKFQNILSQYKNQNFQTFRGEIEITSENKVFYWILNPTNFNYIDINFNNSEFFLIKDLFIKQDKLNIKSLNDFLNEKERIESLGFPYQFRIEKLSFKSSSNKNFLIIDNIKSGIGYYVSESLKNEIENNHLTGVKFEEIEN